jgi:hypothetical protein
MYILLQFILIPMSSFSMDDDNNHCLKQNILKAKETTYLRRYAVCKAIWVYLAGPNTRTL